MNIILTLSFRIMRHNLLHLLTLALALMGGGEMAWGETTYRLQQVTSVEAGGLYVFEQDGYVMKNSISSSGLQTTNSYQSKGLTGTENYIWKLQEAKGGYYMRNVSNGYSSCFLHNSSSTTLKLVNSTSGASSASIWTFTFQDDGTVVIQNKSFENRFLGYSTTSSHLYKAYASGTIISDNYPHAIKVYKLVEESSATVPLNASGYATFASTKPLDFTSTEGVTAWKVKEVDGTSLGFEQITGAVQAGTGVLLMGNASTSVEIPYAESGDEQRDNKLVGITKDTEISAGTYYGLKGTSFVPVNDGTIPAGKALLPAEAVPSSVKAFTFVFDDVDGIRTVKTVTPDEAQAIFNLSGQRLPKTQRGLNIINGKKVIMK